MAVSLTPIDPAELTRPTLTVDSLGRRWAGLPPATISSAQVESIRSRAQQGETFKSIAQDLGVHSATVSRIARRLRRVS